jgi:hypothetical protein
MESVDAKKAFNLLPRENIPTPLPHFEAKNVFNSRRETRRDGITICSSTRSWQKKKEEKL